MISSDNLLISKLAIELYVQQQHRTLDSYFCISLKRHARGSVCSTYTLYCSKILSSRSQERERAKGTQSELMYDAGGAVTFDVPIITSPE
jgi:hypothetical protein